MGKSYKDRGDKYFQPAGKADDGSDDEFDFKEYMRRKAEEEKTEDEIEKSMPKEEPINQEEEK